MPKLLRELVIDRVDFVDEGANSAAFIELYKRKEPDQMDFEDIVKGLKPEHVTVVNAYIDKVKADAAVDLTKAKEDLATATEALKGANEQLDVLKEATKDQCVCGGEENEKGHCKACGKPKMEPKKAKEDLPFDQTETYKSLPQEAKDILQKAKADAEAATEALNKANAERIEKEAQDKAETLKALPVAKAALVGIIKNASKEVLDVLAAAAKLIEKGGLAPTGKDGDPGTTGEAYAKMTTKATEIAKTRGITTEQAFLAVMKEFPDLYKEYLKQEEEENK